MSSIERLREYAARCETHHEACDCRQYADHLKFAELEAKVERERGAKALLQQHINRATLLHEERAAEVERLRTALVALVEDVNAYGEPRRHADAIRAAEEATRR